MSVRRFFRDTRAVTASIAVLVVVLLLGGLSIYHFTHRGSGPAVAAKKSHDAELKRSFMHLKTEFPVGVALVPVGGGDPLLLGDQTTPLAWSISKVPLSLITERNGGGGGMEEVGITESSEDAAWAMTLAMGTGENAISTITQTLREGGDENTVVTPNPGAAPWPFFGETPWTVEDSAIWTAHLPCMHGSAPVIDRMSRVNSDQDWGLRSVWPTAPVKGGWGENDPNDGKGPGYTVRQIGLLTLPTGGQTAVSMAVYNENNSFGSGTTILNQVAQWLSKEIDKLPGGHCPVPGQKTE